ncbi:pyrokinin-1 receptor-like [Dreissena polymorpha]|uniref:pyrokinin-1 receptor-like n=1 Tax=Dreissena polymorpha TaxID=45954 RepID=UPI002264F3E9|nr:pyrokinin-1 receptor-like [Dreissena polymorpha]
MAKDDRPGYVSINGSGNTFEYFNRSDDYIKQLLIANLGEKRKSMFTVVFLTMIYATIFLTGVIGNLSTCIVIWKNTYMHTVTNYYLFTLAISDVMTLLLALPPEVYSIWEAYPWRFGQSFCILKSFIMEMTSYSSVLTITGFTVERYLSICHPMKLQHCCHISRAKRCIVLICVVSILSALPYPVHTRTFYYLSDPHSGQHIPDSLVCNIPQKWTGRMIIVFQLSTFVYFVLPMAILSLMYILIGIKLHRTELRTKYDTQYGQATATKARRAILKMLGKK